MIIDRTKNRIPEDQKGKQNAGPLDRWKWGGIVNKSRVSHEDSGNLIRFS
jgi:hypothetical protein